MPHLQISRIYDDHNKGCIEQPERSHPDASFSPQPRLLSLPSTFSNLENKSGSCLPSSSSSTSTTSHLASVSDKELLRVERAFSSSLPRNPSQIPASRIDRLLQQRQINRNRRFLDQDRHRHPGHDVCTEPRHSGTERLQFGNRVDAAPSCRQRLLVVANRLPVSATRHGDAWTLELSAGGLVSALLGVRQFETRWIGWAGVHVPDEVGQNSLRKALDEKRCVPVFLDEETVHRFYNGYCNNVLWPLFHYLGLPQEDRLSATRSLEDQFKAYMLANEKFAEVVYSIYEEGDVIWCHDYHLMFLPKHLKEYGINIKVGWFLHTPFPSSEIYRMLPCRSELLNAVLAADLIGFHTYDYARHFVSACTRILGLEGTRSGVEDHISGKLTRVAALNHWKGSNMTIVVSLILWRNIHQGGQSGIVLCTWSFIELCIFCMKNKGKF